MRLYQNQFSSSGTHFWIHTQGMRLMGSMRKIEISGWTSMQWYNQERPDGGFYRRQAGVFQIVNAQTRTTGEKYRLCDDNPPPFGGFVIQEQIGSDQDEIFQGTSRSNPGFLEGKILWKNASHAISILSRLSKHLLLLNEKRLIYSGSSNEIGAHFFYFRSVQFVKFC